MKKVYTTANGKQINIDSLIAQNESTIAVGNMKVNARGDKLGPGGKVEVPKEKLMTDYYKLNTPTAIDTPLQPRQPEKKKDLVDDWIEPVEEEVEPEVETKPQLRGRLADSVAKTNLEVKETPKKTGPSRI